jgi:IS30 family transposase
LFFQDRRFQNQAVVQACARVLLPLADRIETITYDNGNEFASHVEIATSLGSLSYFAKRLPDHRRLACPRESADD